MRESRFKFVKGEVCAAVMAFGMFLTLSTAWAISQEDQVTLDTIIVPSAEAGVDTTVARASEEVSGLLEKSIIDELVPMYLVSSKS